MRLPWTPIRLKGFNTFTGRLEYYIGTEGPYTAEIIGDSQVDNIDEPPTSTIVSPPPLATLSGTVTIEVEAVR